MTSPIMQCIAAAVARASAVTQLVLRAGIRVRAPDALPVAVPRQHRHPARQRFTPRPVALVLVQRADERARIECLLRASGTIPIGIRSDGIAAALAYYRPSALVLDAAYMATASEEFFSAADAAQVDLLAVEGVLDVHAPTRALRTTVDCVR